jgi:hypothetical protein
MKPLGPETTAYPRLSPVGVLDAITRSAGIRVHIGDRVQSPYWIENDKIDLSDAALADKTAMLRETAREEFQPMPLFGVSSSGDAECFSVSPDRVATSRTRPTQPQRRQGLP